MFYRQLFKKIKVRTLTSIFALALSLGMLVGAAGTASAYTYTYGSTWFSNGTRQATGSYGATISAYATGAVPYTPYKLVSGKNGCTTDIVPLNNTVVYASTSGLIGTVTGTITRPAGTYDVCFYSVQAGAEGRFITSPVTFTLKPVISGSTWFSNGTRFMSGPSGSVVKAYATGAIAYTPYQLVSGKNSCTTDIVPLNTAIVYAGSTGLIGTVTGTINRPAGTYDVCFYSVNPGGEGATITSVATFVVN